MFKHAGEVKNETNGFFAFSDKESFTEGAGNLFEQ